jgi:spore coat protein U-like protein
MRTAATITCASVLVAAALAASVIAAAAQARRSCPEGRLADGTCINPDLAQDLRIGSIALAQSKLSMTNPPVLPSQDALYDVPRDHHEIRSLHGTPPITSVNGRSVTIVDSFNRTTTVNTGPLP